MSGPEPSDGGHGAGAPRSLLSGAWREGALRAQQEVLPAGTVTVSCPAPYGSGGLGRHLQEIVEALGRRGSDVNCLCESGAPEGAPPAGGGRDPRAAALRGMMAPLGRLSPAWRIWAASVAFDLDCARALPPADHLIAFNGTASAQMGAPTGHGSPSLMAANSHMRRVIERHAAAASLHPIEPPWSTRLLARNLAEYERAERIYVSSAYTMQSFLDEGHDPARLAFFPLTPAPRYVPAPEPPASGTFDILYVGSLTVNKGVPLLIDAVRALALPELRLILVGGWKTRGMRRFIEAAMAADPRISVAPGDPLARLQAARLCVHATYEDGFAYAPAEALACGVPVIVSQDTGMKELVDPGRSGLIVPTGSVRALSEAIEAVHDGAELSRPEPAP